VGEKIYNYVTKFEKAEGSYAEGSYAAMIPRLKTWDSNKDERVSRALLLSETLRERVTLEYSLTLRYRYR